MDEFKIGIWGTSRTGKTTYLALLYQVFLADERWEIYTEDSAASLFIERAMEQIAARSFPEPTVETRAYRYHLVNRADPTQRYLLEFLDAPGELFEDYYARELRETNRRVAQRSTESRETDWIPSQIFEYLTSCQGLLILLDPERAEAIPKPRPYHLLLYQLLEDLRDYRRDAATPAPLLALCLTKADGSTDLWSRRAIVAPHLCYRVQSDNPDACHICPVFEQLDERFMLYLLKGLHPLETIRCFVTSAIGRIHAEQSNVGSGSIWQRPDTAPPPIFEHIEDAAYAFLSAELRDNPVEKAFLPTSISQPNAIRSFGLIEPVLWMIEQRTYP